MKKMTIEIDENGIVLVLVDGEPVGIFQSMKIHASASHVIPDVEFVYYDTQGGMKELRERLPAWVVLLPAKK